MPSPTSLAPAQRCNLTATMRRGISAFSMLRNHTSQLLIAVALSLTLLAASLYSTFQGNLQVNIFVPLFSGLF